MVLGYLISPVIQVENTNGKPLTGGWINVYRHGTTIPAVTYKDFHGDMNPQNIYLDHKGMCIILVDADGMYDVYCYDSNGVEQWSRLNLGVTGGAGGAAINITSSDNSVNITKIIVGGVTNFDLTRPEDTVEMLEWIRCDGSTRWNVCGDTFVPIYTAGTMEVGTKGIKLYGDHYYHVTAHIRVTKPDNAEPWYDEMFGMFVCDYGNGYETVVTQKSLVADYSMGLTQEYEISTDVCPIADCELLIDVADQTINQYKGIELIDVEAHRIYSGAPATPMGVASKTWVEENYQPLLTAGDNIYIDTTTWTISASGGSGGGSIYNSGDGTIVHNTGNHEIDIDWTKVQPKLTAGEGISIVNNVISAVGGGGGGDYTGENGVYVDNVNRTIGLDSDVVVDPDYHHTDYNFTLVYKNKLDGIEDGAERNVQSDWTQTDNTADDFIKHKPANLVQDADYVHTDNNFSDTAKDKLDGIEAGAEVNVQSDWLQDNPDADDFIKNKPPVLVGKELVAGTNIAITQNANDVTISALYASGTYDTQSVSGSEHIFISSDCQWTTDLTPSGEIAAVGEWLTRSGPWFTLNDIGNDGENFQTSDYTGGVTYYDSALNSTLNDAFVLGRFSTSPYYTYSVDFNMNGLLKPRSNMQPYQRMYIALVDVNDPLNEYFVVRSGLFDVNANLELHWSFKGRGAVAIRLYNVDSEEAEQDIGVKPFPRLSIIARKL